MKVYVVETASPVRVVWTKARAEEIVAQRRALLGNAYFYEVDIDPLYALVSEYYARRGLKYPSDIEAFLWLISEVGEAAEVLLNLELPDGDRAILTLAKNLGAIADYAVNERGGWVRNREPRNDDIGKELGDILMMLIVCAYQLGVHLPNAMKDRMEEKLGAF